MHDDPCTQTHSTDLSGLIGPYSLTEIITIGSTGANTFSLDQNLTGVSVPAAVPEPGSILLLALGFVALGVFVRRRR